MEGVRGCGEGQIVVARSPNQASVFFVCLCICFALMKCSQRIQVLSTWHLCIDVTCLEACEFVFHDIDEKEKQNKHDEGGRKGGRKEGRKEEEREGRREGGMSVKYHIYLKMNCFFEREERGLSERNVSIRVHVFYDLRCVFHAFCFPCFTLYIFCILVQ